MSEVDQIEAALEGPVNSWLNNKQLVLYHRLVQIARSADIFRRIADAPPAVELQQISMDEALALVKYKPVSGQ